MKDRSSADTIQDNEIYDMEHSETDTGISSFALKMIAVSAMLADHIGALILVGLTSRYNSYGFFIAERVFRGIGRLSFPLFCFFITEGFHYTHSRFKYALRLFIFAVISEVPYDLAFSSRLLNIRDNNVMWTLLAGLLCICILSYTEERTHTFPGKFGEAVFTLTAMAVTSALWFGEKYIIRSDYGFAGAAAIIMIWLFRQNKLFGFAASVMLLGVLDNETELFALADLILLLFYNGRQGHKIKYFFYIFYPAHLLLLALIRDAAFLF